MSTLTTLTEDNKRWLVFGISLNHVLIPSIRPILEQEILKEYNHLKATHGIDVQISHSFPVSRYLNVLKYENINANDTKLKPPHNKKLDYSKFDYNVTSHVDFAKLFLQKHMAKFNAFNETCDASAVLNLLGRIPVFSVALQNAANVVREGRNAWGHCNFTDWNEVNFKTRFNAMKQLVTEMRLSSADESKVLADLKDWEDRGVLLCMNATIDPDLAKLIQEHVTQLSDDVQVMSFEKREEFNKIQQCLRECEERITKIERQQEVVRQELILTAVKLDQLTTNQAVSRQKQSFTAHKVDQLEIGQKTVEKRVTDLEGQMSSLDFSSCEADINYYAERYDPDTRQWFLHDFDAWFSKSGESRAYVLLGDAAVGKSVMAAVIAQRARNDGNLAAAHFCRHYDGTRRDPRYLLGTIAHQLRNCNSEYDRVVGGDTGILRMLANDKLGVHELFTKLLEEPLSKCSFCKRKLVVIDALDETEYWSREDFLDLIMNRFPRLPNLLVFFITSRPEDTVQFRLKTYNPCIRICAGNSDSAEFYQQHELDIQRFLEKRIDFSVRSYSAKQLTNKCNGMFLYAFFIAEFLKNSTRLDIDIFPEHINTFFYNNFKRVCEKIGSDFYKKLFGSALVAPSPLPISFISFILLQDNSALDKQEVFDAVSLFVAWRTSDKTFAFLHNLIPAWLTDKERAPRTLFIDKNTANEYFRKIIVEFFDSYLKEEKDFVSCDSRDLVDYVLENGIRFLCNCRVELCGISEMIFNCLTNYRFLKHRIKSKIGIYSLIEDCKFSVVTHTFNEKKKNILDFICSALEQDKYVIAGNPELLYSCLRNAIKLSQESVISGNVSWMELELDLAFSVRETLLDMKCGAFSHDKKLFAGGKGRYIYLYDALSFRKISAPFGVMSKGTIVHLEFSPNDRFVFFGRLDAWFSVQDKRVVEITQFAGNFECYQWGSFIYDGKFIAVSRAINLESHKVDCFIYIFYKWLVKEFDLEQGNANKNIRRQFSSFRIGELEIGVKELVHSLLNLHKNVERIKLGLCSSCAEFENLETPVRDRIVLLYADIFEHQIWNVQTGKPVIQEMFSSQVKLKPFFYLWHFFPVMNNFEDEICDKSMTLGNIVVLNYVSFINKLLPLTVDLMEEIKIMKRWKKFKLRDRSAEGLTYFLRNTPVECCNYIFRDNSYDYSCSISKNERWLAYFRFPNFKLFEIEIGCKSSLNHRQDVDHSSVFLEEHAFTSDCDIFVYITCSEKQDRTLCALSIISGMKLQSFSGFYPVHWENVEGHGIGYMFFGCDEKETVLLRDLPWRILRYLTGNPAERINAAFTTTDRIMLVCSNAAYMTLEIVDGAWMIKHDKLNHAFSKETCVKKCIFSDDRKLVAIHESCHLLLFDGNKFLCSVFKVEENCEHTITCLTFSHDNCLLSFCIEKESNAQHFYLWDVKKRVLFGPIAFPDNFYGIPVDSCYFSSDNKKLILCSAFSVLVLEDPPKFGRFTKHYDIPKLDFGTFQLRTHCTVSSDDKLLACCVANEILIYSLDGPETFWKVQHNHSGRIEFCRFLKKNRYLISYGIDCVVALFDICEWKPVAYARFQESIISMAVSPDEEKLVCLKSSGDVSILKLHGLKCGLPSKFRLPSNFGLQNRSHEPAERQRRSQVPPRIEVVKLLNDTGFKKDQMLSPDDFCESSDEDESDEMYVVSDDDEDQIIDDLVSS